MPLRARVFANIARINELGRPYAPRFNAFLEKGWGKWVLSRLGVHPARELPKLAPRTFSQWYWGRNGAKVGEGGGGQKQVVFFHDTFIEHNDPHIGRAAIAVLEAAGYEPVLLREKKCCGRPAVSKGALNLAQKLARHNLELLAPYANEGIPIVGCEPSCMTMLVDEYCDLVPGEDSRTVAEMSMSLDEFLVREAEAGTLKLDFDESPRKVLFHGHCQQKANFGTESTHKLLHLIPNCSVEEIESGCCGMAGSFGYEKEHYDLSLKLAEMALAPAVRAAQAETIICATGTSCRDQIAHTTERNALHPIEVLAEALAR
jgi:Fe-S oxidoreductase